VPKRLALSRSTKPVGEDRLYFIPTRAARVLLFSVVSVCLSIDTITPEPLEIESQNFQSIILWSKWRPSSKTAVQGCTAGDLRSLVFGFMTGWLVGWWSGIRCCWPGCLELTE